MPALGLASTTTRAATCASTRWCGCAGSPSSARPPPCWCVYFGLDFSCRSGPASRVIALSAWLNVALRLRFHMTQRLEPDRAAWLLAFDIAELAVLLFLTGGLQNPFAFLFLAPVLLSATALPPRFTLMLGAFAIACATVLVFVHYPLPWDSDDPLQLPPIYMLGVWLSILLAIGFIGVYAWQITEESPPARRRARRHRTGAGARAASLAARRARRRRRARARHAALDHLGDRQGAGERARRRRRRMATTCGCCASRRRAAATSSAKLTELSSSGEPFDRMPLSALIEEVVAPHRNFGVAIDVAAPPARDAEPVGARNPAILYGLGNLLENAVDFAHERVDGRRALERGRRRGHHQRRRPGLRAGDHGPHRRALRHQPPPQARTNADSETGRTGLGLFHRQDLARTLRRHAELREPRLSANAAPSSRCAGAGAISSGR